MFSQVAKKLNLRDINTFQKLHDEFGDIYMLPLGVRVLGIALLSFSPLFIIIFSPRYPRCKCVYVLMHTTTTSEIAFCFDLFFPLQAVPLVVTRSSSHIRELLGGSGQVFLRTAYTRMV